MRVLITLSPRDAWYLVDTDQADAVVIETIDPAFAGRKVSTYCHVYVSNSAAAAIKQHPQAKLLDWSGGQRMFLFQEASANEVKGLLELLKLS